MLSIVRSFYLERIAPRPQGEIICIILFALLSAVSLNWLIYRAILPIEIDRNEWWNAWHVGAWLAGRPIYPNPVDLTVNNYPPLSFYVVGLIAKTGADPIYAGRLLSLASTLVIAAAIAGIVRRLGGARMAAVFCALWYLATMFGFYRTVIGMNDPHLLGLAVMSVAMLWFLTLLAKGKIVEPAIAAMVLAGFIKHSLFAIPLTSLVWLAMMDRRAAFRALLFGATITAAGLMLCYSVYGPVFIESLLLPREMDIFRSAPQLGRLQSIALALIVWGMWAYPNRSRPAARFTALFIFLAFIISFVQRTGAGVDVNALFELFVATAIGLGVTISNFDSIPLAARYGVDRVRNIVGIALVVRLLLNLNIEPYLLLTSSAYRQEISTKVQVFNSEVARIKALPYPVSCLIGAVCYRAGKAFVFDDFAVTQMIRAGRLSKERVNAVIAEKQINFMDIDWRATWSSPPRLQIMPGPK